MKDSNDGVKTAVGCLLMACAGAVAVSLIICSLVGRPDLTLKVAGGMLGQYLSMLIGAGGVLLFLILLFRK